MNQSEIRSMLHILTAQKAPPAQIDLWPAIQSRIQMSQPKQTKGIIMNTHSNSRRKPWILACFLAAILLIGALFILLPQGRALAQVFLHFFIKGETNVMPGPTSTLFTWVEQTPGAAAPTNTPPSALTPQPTPPAPAFEEECGPINDPHCSVEAIRSMVNFPVFALAEFPQGMNFIGASGGPDGVSLVYTTPNHAASLIISEEPFAGAEDQLAWEVGADADIQYVQVGAVTAEYVKGSYDGNSNPPVWNSNIDVQTLCWVDQDLLFIFDMIGSEPHLGRDDLAALAATLTDGPLGVKGLPASVTTTPTGAVKPTDSPHTFYPLTLAEAEEKAGFKLLTPSRLPETLSFIGTNYNEETKVVELFYQYHYLDPEVSDGLVISEQLALLGTDCDLCGYIQGNGKQVEEYPIGKLVSEDVQIESVQIGSLTGQYLEGVGWTSWIDCCGWQWDPTPYIKRLRFRTDDLAIAISFYGFDLTKTDILKIAENLK